MRSNAWTSPDDDARLADDQDLDPRVGISFHGFARRRAELEATTCLRIPPAAARAVRVRRLLDELRLASSPTDYDVYLFGIDRRLATVIRLSGCMGVSAKQRSTDHVTLAVSSTTLRQRNGRLISISFAEPDQRDNQLGA